MTFAGFKHRTFTEFLYAKAAPSKKSLEIDRCAFQLYWMNTFFFYIGLQRDCPDLLKEIVAIDCEAEPERWLKVINVANYLLAGYTSPYDAITHGLKGIMLETARLYLHVVSGAYATMKMVVL